MSLLPFTALPAYRTRRFVPEKLDLGDWDQIAPSFDRLEERAPLCRTTRDLEDWILDAGELAAAVEEEGARRYIAMTCHTDNPEAEKAYLHFVEQIEPKLKPRLFRLDELYTQHPLRPQLPRNRYEVFDRDRVRRVELFRPENVPLETEEAKLGQQYQKLCGSLTVQFRGAEKTLAQMAPYLEDPDRALRQEAWELVARRRLQERDSFDHILDELLKLRSQIASNAGFPNYLEYAFRLRGRFDYGPKDCLDFHAAIEREVMPLVLSLHTERQQQLRLPALRPWDLAVDPLNRPPLRPFQQAEEMVQGAQRIFDRLDDELAGGFRKLSELRLLDLSNRKGKAPGGYQSTLSESRWPFIFMNAVGVQRDIETILHEAGHAFHALATREEDLFAYRDAPIEFCEVASMSMELLGNEYLDAFYPPEEIRRARRDHLEGILELFPWVATVDAFQHWLYAHPGHSRSERASAWVALMDRFGGAVDWAGHEEARAHLWHRQLHIFLHPFYYVEYAIAQLGALQVWSNYRRERGSALKRYREALSLGGSRPLPELFAAAGCQFRFDAAALRPLMQRVREELEIISKGG